MLAGTAAVPAEIIPPLAQASAGEPEEVDEELNV